MKRRLAAVACLGMAVLAARAALAAPEPAGSELAGRFAFRTFDDDDGLANPTVECLLQDREGFLWIGTQDGLFRFDGRRFARFGRDEGLPSSRINALHQTAGGRLYVGTRTGLAVLATDGSGQFLPLGPKHGLPAIVAIPDQGIASGPGGEVYVGTPEGLFVGKAGDRFVPEPFAEADGTRETTALHWTPGPDPAGTAALLYARGGRLFRRAAGKTVEIGRALGLPDGERIDQAATDGAGRLWIRKLTQLWVLPPQGSTEPRRFRRDDDGLPEGVASGRLALDDRGRILVPTSQGLAYRDGEGWRRIGRREGLASDTVLSALVDREGSLWIGLAGSGLAQQLGRGAFTAWGSAEGLSHDVVWAINRQKGGTGQASGPLWVGTEDGLDRIDLETGEIRVYREADGLAGGTVYALAAGRDGSVWAGSWPGGITRFGPEPDRVRRYGAEGIAASELLIVTLYFDRSGNLWAGARSGVYRLDAGSSATLLRPVRLPGWDDRDSVYGFAEDRAGTVYAVGRYGLQRLTGPAPRRFRQADGFQSDFLSSVAAAAPGEPWDLIVGYREALGAARVKVEGGRLRIEPLDASRGLSFDKVLFLGRDAAGALWVGGGAGIDVFRRPGGKADHFSRASGLITEDTSQNAFFAEPDGTVWIGTSRGLVRYRPGGEVRPPLPPPILLTGVTAGRRSLGAGGSAPLTLERDERDLLVSWASPTFLDPARVRFRHRLAGLEESFRETSAQEARYAALPTGSYRLEVVAVSAAGQVSPRPAVLSFTVRPAWWERPWAWAAGALLLGLAVAGAIRLRTRALEADRRLLEAAVEERSAALARAVRELEEVSSTDFLTGTRNRRYLNAVIGEDMRQALLSHSLPAASRPVGRDLLLFLVDLDHFKAVNDQYGHGAGDRLLVEAARRLQAVTRGSDLVVRWGGEEFLIVARASSRVEAGAFAARVLEAVGGRPYELGDPGQSSEAAESLTVGRTCSVGWAPFPWFPDDPQALGFDQVLTLADHALYLAKSTGRDRAVGVLPLGPGAESGPRPAGWWRQPLAEAEGRWVRLVRTGRDELPDTGRTAAGGAP